MRTYEERAKDFIKDFAPYCKGARDYDDFLRAVMAYRKDHPRRNISFKHGVTRVALITSDYVIKIDYHHNGYEWAGDSANECSNYAQAVEDGFEYLFAACTKYRCRNRNFYIMPKVTGIGNHSRNFWKALTPAEEDYVSDHCCDMHEYNYGWNRKTGKPVIIDYAPY